MTNRADALQRAFAGAQSSRTDALRAITLPEREPTPAPPDAATSPGPSQDPPPEAGAPPAADHPGAGSGKEKGRRPRPLQTAPAPADSTPDRGGARSTIVYVTPRIRDALRQRAAQETQVTFTDLVLDALETYEADLRHYWATPRRPSGRFARTPPRQMRRAEPGVQLALRLTRSNLAVLDHMVDELGAPSRTALVEQALRRYFDAELTSDGPSSN